MGLNTVPANWVAAEIPTAAKLNAQIRDAFIGLQAPWVDYVPVWTGTTTNPVLGNGTLVGSYHRVGKSIDFSILLTMGSTTTYGAGTWVLTLPVQCTTPAPMFMGIARDSAPVAYYPVFGGGSSTTIVLRTGSATALLASITPTAPFTWAVGDTLSVQGRYETAA